MMISGILGIDYQVLFALFGVSLVVAVFVFMIRSKSTERHEPNVVRSDPPIRKPEDPAFIRRQSKAAAAAMILHRKRHTSGELNEKS